MNIIAINGSPRPEGNVTFLLKKALKVAQDTGFDTDIIHVNSLMLNLKVPFCIHCSSPCSKSCYSNTELEKIYELLSQADGIIMGSPVYFGTVSAQLKAFWDKTRALRTAYKLMGKIGAAISVGASPYGGQETTLRALQDMMFIHGMTLVGDGMYQISAGHQGLGAQQPVFNNRDVIKSVENLAQRVVAEVLKR